MNLDKMLKTIFSWLLRALLLALGLVFLLSLLVAALLLLIGWGLRALWARATGRPVPPLVFTVLRRAQWQRFYRAGGPGAATGGRAAEADEVIDVESRTIASGTLPPDKTGG